MDLILPKADSFSFAGVSAANEKLYFSALSACPACPVAPADGTGVGPEDRTGASRAKRAVKIYRANYFMYEVNS